MKMQQRAPKTTETQRTSRSVAPSASLMTAALAGLLGVGGCDDEEKNPDLLCEPPATVPVAPSDASAAPVVSDAAAPAPVDTGVAPQDAAPAPVDAGTNAATGDGGPVGPIVQEAVVGDVSFATLKANCETRGGYIQVHAACAGANDCKGFSYGDFSPGELTEHTCAGANSCTGASCVLGPTDTGKTGKQVYEQENYPPGGPASCLNCHAIWGLKDANGNDLPPDSTKFKLWVLPGGTRNETNWLELSAEAQEQIVSFGKQERFPDGITLSSMKGYHALWSREEIKRVVAHVRTLTPVLAEIKRPK